MKKKFIQQGEFVIKFGFKKVTYYSNNVCKVNLLKAAVELRLLLLQLNAKNLYVIFGVSLQ